MEIARRRHQEFARRGGGQADKSGKETSAKHQQMTSESRKEPSPIRRRPQPKKQRPKQCLVQEESHAVLQDAADAPQGDEGQGGAQKEGSSSAEEAERPDEHKKCCLRGLIGVNQEKKSRFITERNTEPTQRVRGR
eukprot:s2080_g6.t1